ncbi:MAG: DegT/DnrJ/EryC1/StrS family aminotransferase [Candidatus Blackburnbacteria bacterium]|nr:DegT/DnrJ/EryC1/StrS family aminotransferase [Candidatus Blackburnbacteria bacterium]
MGDHKGKSIPFWTYLRAYELEKKEIQSAIKRVFLSGQLILGPEVEKFEEEFAKFCNSSFGIGVGNGTDALFIALKALGVGKGDEVITVPNTAIPTASAICATGARPVFVDINPDTLLLDPEKIEEKITKRTRAILPVHLYGQCCDMDKISMIAKKHKLFVLEDCAQATGAKWRGKFAGSMSDIAAFSFYPTKILGAYGDGGMIVTSSKRLASLCRMLRTYGMRRDYYSQFLGYNSRLDEIQAAILRERLKKIDSYIKKRKNVAKRYYDRLAKTSLTLPSVDPNASHVYHLFVCRHEKRDAIISYMQKRGITLAIHYPHPLHLMKGFSHLGYKKGDFPIAEEAAREVLSLPLYPELEKAEQGKIISSLHSSISVLL